MTPKEKAEELMRKFYHGGFSRSELNNHFSKLTAIKVVEEIIEATSIRYEYNSDFELKITGKKPLQYWLDVKQEIEQL